MTTVIAGDLEISDNYVRLGPSVGKYATNAQTSVLIQTARNLGKIYIEDRYPTDPFFARGIEAVTHYNEPRNENGVPIRFTQMVIDLQFRRMWGLAD